MSPKAFSEPELDDLLERARGLPERGWRHEARAGLDLFAARHPEGDEIVHVYARPERGAALVSALDLARTEVPRLVAEVRRLREEVEASRARPPAPASVGAPARASATPAAAPARDLDIDEGAGLGLAAPFRVSPKAVHAAKTDPLVALSVQVARALQEDAKDVERARLIAMAHAAARGDLEAFWTARRMRTAKAESAKGAGKTKGAAARKADAEG
jgi:hypothetical protein